MGDLDFSMGWALIGRFVMMCIPRFVSLFSLVTYRAKKEEAEEEGGEKERRD